MGQVIRLLTILLLCCASANAAIPIIFLRAGTNAVVVPPGDPTNLVETDFHYVEAEDFNTGGDVYFNSNPAFGHSFNAAGLYDTTTATEGTDYSSASSSVGEPYRTGTGIFHVEDNANRRVGFDQFGTGIDDFTITNFASAGPDWLNFTRNFAGDCCQLGSPTNYHVYVQVSDHGGGAANIVMGLHDVTNPTNFMGSFTTNTAGDGTYVYVPAKLGGTNIIKFLDDVTVFRVSNSNDVCRLQRLMFARIEYSDTTDAFLSARDGTALISPRDSRALRGNQ